jgi:ubiquinone/menaquinone biosynthesis C-methylase UbiE
VGPGVLASGRSWPSRRSRGRSCHTGASGEPSAVGLTGIRAGSYGDLGERFDDLFEDVERLTMLEASSLESIFGQSGVRTVLDCACGTGIQAIGLAQLGYTVAASDISPRMLAVLDRKARKRGLSIPTRRQDFRSLAAWPGRTFDAVICCGESLPVVPRRGDIARALGRMVAVASESGGLLVVGLHNYALLRNRNDEFCIQRPFRDETHGFAFDARIFGTDSVEVVHTIALLQENRWRMRSVTVTHQYLTAAELRASMLVAGCCDVQLLDVTGTKQVEEAEWVLAVGTTGPRPVSQAS